MVSALLRLIGLENILTRIYLSSTLLMNPWRIDNQKQCRQPMRRACRGQMYSETPEDAFGVFEFITGQENAKSKNTKKKSHMKLRESLKTIIAGILTIGLVGCASIIDGSTKHVSVRSEPSDAKATVFDRSGQAIQTQQTPAILTLKSGRGYFLGARYHLVVEKAGYQKAELDLTPTLNGWYLGNVIFGGLIGLLIVDPATGAMYTLTPKDVNLVLQKQNVGMRPEKSGLVVMLRKDVPTELASRLVPVSTP